MATEDVVFRGQFDLSDALNDFEVFAREIRRRMGLLSQGLASKNQAKIDERVEHLMGVNEAGLKRVEAKLRAFKERIQRVIEGDLVDRRKAEATMQSLDRTVERYTKTLTRLNIKQEEKIALTKADIIAMRQLENEMDKFDTVTRRAEKSLALTNHQVKESARRFNEFFRGMVIGGFALQQFGALMAYNVTMPMFRMGQQILDTTLKFDTLENLLTKRGKRSLTEIGQTMDAVGKAAKLRNFDLDSSVTLYSKLFEATRGAIDDGLFDKVTKGLSEVMSTIEPSEKLGFFGQIQDILGGGNVANLEKTLSLAPALKSVFDEIARSAKEGASQQSILLEALTKLSEKGPIDDLATKIKNLRVQFELWGYRIGQVYKDELVALITYIETSVFPAIDKLIVRFEKMHPILQNLILGVAGLTAALGPLIFAFGTLMVVTGGVAQIGRMVAGGFAILTGSTKAAALATEDFAVLLARFAGPQGMLPRLGAFLARIPGLINPITLAVAAVIALLGGALVTNAGHARDALVLLWESATAASKDAYSIMNDISYLLKVLIVDTGALSVALEVAGGALAGFLGALSISVRLQPQVLLLQSLARVLNLITSIVSEGAEIGLYRFAVALLETGKAAEKSLPFLERFVNWLFKDNPEGMKTTSEAIETYKKKIYELGGEVDGHTKRQDALKNKNKELRVTLENNATAIENVTKKIKEQADAIDKLVESLQKQLEAQRDTAEQAESSYRQAELERELSAVDLGTPEGYAAGKGIVQKMNAEDFASIGIQNAKEYMMNVRSLMAKQLAVLAQAQTAEVNQLYKDFYAGVIVAFEQNQAQNMELVLEDMRKTYGFQKPGIGVKLSPQDIKIDEIITQAKEFARQQLELKGTVASIQTENLMAARERARQREENLKRMREEEVAASTEEERLEGLRKQLDFQEKIQLNLEQQRDALVKEFEITENITDFTERLAKLKTALLFVAEQKNAVELKMIEGSKEKASKKKAATNAANRQYKDEVEGIGAMFTDITSDQLQKIIARQKDNKKWLEELNQTYLDNLQQRVKLVTQIARATGAVDVEKTRRQIEEFNKALLTIAQSGITDSYNEVLTRLKALGDTKKPVLNQLEGIIEMLASLGKANTAGFLTTEQAQVFTDAIAGYIKILQAFLGTAGISPTDASEAQKNIEALKKLAESIQGGRVASDKTVDAKRTELEIREATLERELEIKKIQQDQLEIARQLIEARQKGLGTLNAKGIGKEILDIFTGGSRAQYELQKQMIEMQIAASKIETDLALVRLEIDIKRLEIEMRRLGYSEEEIEKMKDLYKQEAEQLKKRAAMQEELLKKQIEGLAKYGGGITGAVVGIVDSLFRKKKKTDEEETPPFGLPTDKDNPDFGDIGDVTDKATKDTDKYGKVLDEIPDKYKDIASAAGQLGAAIMELDEITLKSLRNAVAKELQALAAKAAVRALEFGAVAISALVYGDYEMATKAGLAAALWTGVAVAASAGASLLGTAEGNSVATTQSGAASGAGTSADFDADKNAEILRARALSVLIQLDIRTDDGIIIKKNIKAINKNTELTNLTRNSDNSWAFAPAP